MSEEAKTENMLSFVKTSKELSCHFLDQLEVQECFILDTRKEGVTVIESG